jgi:hypothetical protein
VSGSKICERIGNSIRIIDFVDAVFIMTTRSLVQVGFGNPNSNGSTTKQIAKFGFVVEVLARMERGLATKPTDFHGVKAKFRFCRPHRSSGE